MCTSGLLGINIILDSVSALNACLLSYLSASKKLIDSLNTNAHICQLGNNCLGNGMSQGMEIEQGRGEVPP